MARETKNTILVAIIGAMSAVVIAVITTYGTIAVSAPKTKALKEELDLKKIANLPIGTIVSSMLKPTEFAKAVGDLDRETIEWVLADEQKDITNSLYGQLSGRTNTPDLRGMFLRGMNVEGVGGDPEKKRTVGDYQPDALQKHGHKTDALKLWRHISANTSELGYTSTGGADYGPASVMNVTDLDLKPPVRKADETRPKNVAVYFYIKIN